MAHLDAVLEAALTMYQPSAPCSAPSTKMRASLGASAPRDAAAQQEIEEGTGEHDADQPAPQAMEIFPEKIALNCGERHIGMDRAVLRDRLVARRTRPAIAHRSSGGRMPVTGCHCGDREAGFGEPRDAAQHHHDEAPWRSRRRATRRSGALGVARGARRRAAGQVPATRFLGASGALQNLRSRGRFGKRISGAERDRGVAQPASTRAACATFTECSLPSMLCAQKSRNRRSTGNSRRHVELLPDEALQQIRMIGQVIEDLRRGQAVSRQLGQVAHGWLFVAAASTYTVQASMMAHNSSRKIFVKSMT